MPLHQFSPMGAIKVVILCGTYVLVSAALIRFNKYMMSPEHFPYSMQLTTIHMASSLLLCILMYSIMPSAFPRMASTAGHRMKLLRWFGPIGAFFAVALYTSNKAYQYSNVAFLQFMKENNVMIAFMLSCLVGLQQMDRVKLAVIIWVVVGSAMAVGGELHFVWMGFSMQLISQIAECSRAVMGEVVLTGANLRLDPLTYTMFTAPICLAVLLVGNFFAWDPMIPGRLLQNWYLLAPNAFLAFVLNVLVAAVIKETSAVGFALTGVIKDIFIVIVSAVQFHEVVTHRQVIGFILSLSGILMWSYLKTSPQSIWAMKISGALGVSSKRKADERTSLLAHDLPPANTIGKSTTGSIKGSDAVHAGV